ncbi:ATP-binding protein [Arthrospiribacter ruber]|uniref:ATP-binding protein n=1 Tax=Arthrospiribacter ruber TaxID=2487934 RepID=A0A951MDL4_9BACT|nr:ATP-binding protein [Arthrospiribacter ruber]MBW3467815.1 ATP-binding protein [Arthrospiribacter ruber]
MKFYDRSEELKFLQKNYEKSQNQAQMTIMVGRRRIGKTSLLKKSIEGKHALYFFVAKKSESLLVSEFSELIKTTLKISWYGDLKSFKDIFAVLMDYSKQEPFTLVIDEFQEFLNINPAIFSDMQNIWDSKKDDSKINLILCGSIYSMMKRIFEDSKEPLFARATGKIHLQPFGTETIKEILADFSPDYSTSDLLAMYTLTGGVAKYLENMVNSASFNFNDMLDEIFKSNSLMIDEGKHVLIEEFGRDYTTYFSILSLIASSKTSRPEIESIMEMSVGGFLDRLENEFGIIKKIKPVLAKPKGRQIKYKIEDNFLNFWFRFIYKYRSTVEIENFDLLKQIVKRDFATFSGFALEKYFLQKLKNSKAYTAIGTYWEKGNQNEIDIVAVNELEKKLLIAEVKLNKNKFNQFKLIEKSKNILNAYDGYQVNYQCFSLDDM